MYATLPTKSTKSIQNRGHAEHKRRNPTHVEELVAHAYKRGYRFDFNDREHVERVQELIARWSFELVGVISTRTDKFPVATCAVVIAGVLEQATTKKSTWDEFLEALREKLPSNNLNFSI